MEEIRGRTEKWEEWRFYPELHIHETCTNFTSINKL